MPKVSVSTEELLKRIEEARFAAERVRAPYVLAFRATSEEVGMRTIEDAQMGISGEDRLGRFAQRVARAAREAARFERYLIQVGFYPLVPIGDAMGVGP